MKLLRAGRSCQKMGSRCETLTQTKKLLIIPELLFFALYVCLMVSPVTGAFDPLNPGDEENFDPIEADPFGKISCQDEGD